jgi:hypothetical protein
MYVPASSLQDISVTWPASKVGKTVQIAIIARAVPETEPADGDYKAAAWQGTSGTATIKAGLGAGSGGFELAAGEYVVWTRLTDDGTSKPVRRHGTLTVGPPATP